MSFMYLSTVRWVDDQNTMKHLVTTGVSQVDVPSIRVSTSGFTGGSRSISTTWSAAATWRMSRDAVAAAPSHGTVGQFCGMEPGLFPGKRVKPSCPTGTATYCRSVLLPRLTVYETCETERLSTKVSGFGWESDLNQLACKLERQTFRTTSCYATNFACLLGLLQLSLDTELPRTTPNKCSAGPPVSISDWSSFQSRTHD